jgi:hypothetical protein
MTRLISVLLPVSFLCLTLAGCASSPKVTEYQELENNVSSLHESSIFKDTDQRLFTPASIDTFQIKFAEEYCTSGVSEKDCSEQFKRAAAGRLSEIYFAADTTKVTETCANEWLVCADLISLETLFRRLHNASVEESRYEKLSKIENWRQGKLTDEQLKQALHLDFKFEDGKLTLAVPSA